ncbi:MAG: hydantoinase B/oxoprolinase family protein [Planctomycetes bacterium]|nr:hydantoinase B/oxoprolinase family protein [Planctomycetota bacterium]
MAKAQASQKTKTLRPNPADLAFFGNLLTSIAEEMGASLIRSAYSSNIKERRDCSCAVFDGDGRLVAQAAHIPVHLGAMPASVRAALEAFRQLGEGDAVLLNDPYAGGTHLPDLTIVTPVFAPGSKSTRSRGLQPARSHRSEPAPSRQRPVAYLASRAHHADVGGMAPGSLPLSREIYQEGLRLPPVMLREAGRLNQAVVDILRSNSRTPVERAGDLRAQLAAHDVGAGRIVEAVHRYGASSLRKQMTQLIDYGARLMGALIANIPNGAYSFEDVLDDDGLGSGPIKIRVRLTIRGRRVKVDFTGSAPACAGNLNAVEAITCSAVYYCFLCLLVTRSGDHADPPLNAGCFSPITVIAPEGSIVHARPPHAVACGNLETSQRIVDVVFGALAQAVPDVVPAASQGTMNNLTLGGVNPATPGAPGFAYYETIAGGMGARPGADGVDAVQVHMTNTLNTPIEALEFSYPMRVERYEIVPGTGGKGRFRGGNGLRRDIRMLCDVTGTLLCDRREHAPYGLLGGEPGCVGKNTLMRDGRRRALAGKVQLELKAGDVLSVQTPGGGGHGKRVKRRS